MKIEAKNLLLAAAIGSAAQFCAAEAFADAGDWLVRARGIWVEPDESADIALIGGDAEIDKAITGELDFTYFFTNNIAAELILATTNHDVAAVGTEAGNIDLGDVWLLPPVLTLQYHFKNESGVTPYLGAGVNYTIFYNADAPGGFIPEVEYENSFGWALQAGFDVDVSENVFINFDVKKVFLNTDVTVTADLGELVLSIPADVDIDPWIFGAGIGMKF